MNEPEVNLETITPEMAQEMLATSKLENRQLRPSRVHQYAHEMAVGQWQLTGDTIKLNGEQLLDGQHRLAACVESGVPFRTIVVRGVSTGAMVDIDRGLARSLGDAIRFQGKENTSAKAAATGMILKWDRGSLRDSTGFNAKVSRQDMLEFALAHDDALEEACSTGKQINRAIGGSGAVWSAVAYKLRRLDNEAAELFFDQLISGASLREKDPILALRNWVINRIVNNRRTSTAELITAASKAWNAWVTDKPMSVMKIMAVEEPPVLAEP